MNKNRAHGVQGAKEGTYRRQRTLANCIWGKGYTKRKSLREVNSVEPDQSSLSFNLVRFISGLMVVTAL